MLSFKWLDIVFILVLSWFEAVRRVVRNFVGHLKLLCVIIELIKKINKCQYESQ